MASTEVHLVQPPTAAEIYCTCKCVRDHHRAESFTDTTKRGACMYCPCRKFKEKKK